MATSPNLLITHVETGQTQKEVTINEGIDILDESVAGLLDFEFTSDANYTLDVSEPAKEHENFMLKMSDTGTNLTAARNVILPDNRQNHVAWNNTLYELTFKTSSGTGVTVQPGDMSFVYTDGVNVEEISGNAGSLPTFITLSDTPTVYTGQSGKIPKVNVGETALEFVDEGTFTGSHFERPHKGAGVKLTSNKIGVDASTGYTVSWDAEIYDTDSIADLGSFSTRLTVPTGATKIKINSTIDLDNVAPNSDLSVTIYKNGASTPLMPKQDWADGYGNPAVTLQSSVLAVSVTDYFEVRVTCTDTSIDFDTDKCSFHMEIVETSSANNPPYDLGTYYSGVPSNSQELLRLGMTRDITFPVSMTGSTGKSGVAATSSAAFTVKKNAVTFATATFAAAATTVTWVAALETSLAAGDILTIIGPTTADAALADIGFLLKATRDSE